MSEASSVEEILHQAEQLEKEYDWLGATESCEKALKLLPEDDFSRKGETYERLGYAFYRAAFQAESNDEFRRRLRQGIADYERAREHYQRLNDPKKTGTMLRCDAMNVYLGYWLASEAPEKKRLLGECWRFTQESLKASEESGEAEEYGETFNQLSASALLGFCLEWDYQAGEKIIKEVAGHGDVGIKLLSTVDQPDELAKTCAKTAFALSLSAYNFLDLDEKENCLRKAQSYWTKAKEASEDSARLEMLCPVPSAHDLLWGFGTQEALANIEKALEHGRRTRDKFIIGSALDWLTYHTACALYFIDNYDECEKSERAVIQYAEKAKRQYSVISFISSRGDNAWIESIHADVMPGYSRETDLGKRHDILERAIAAGRDALETAETSGYPYAISHTHGMLSRRYRMLAEIESNAEEKKKLLEEALQHESESSRIVERFAPLANWDLGMLKGGLAAIRCELANLARDSETKKSMLYAGILEREDGIKLMLKDLSYSPQKHMASFALLGNMQYSAGDWRSRLYRLTCDKEHLRKVAEVFTEALESYQKANLTSRMAECHWKIAQAYDDLDDHLTAARNFCLASDTFKSAAEKIPQLKSFYEDHALYMQAWGEIEKARHHHERQEYGLAEEHFEKAADLHKSLKQWSYLGPNCAAWAQMEKAEESSRKEQTEEAIEAFEQASKLFSETKTLLQTQISNIENTEEKQMATSFVKATILRYEYCTARITLEEAKILDKKGDHYFSSEKYGSAVKQFEKMSQAMESEQEQREMKFIAVLANAWRKMAEAEAEESPQHYAEACRLFETAKDLGQGEKLKALVLGHSRFCMALEAGTRFTDTREMAEHARAMQYLESASGYYLKADFQNASEYTKATRFLFDSYVHMGNAAKETDPDKKTRLYMVAEKVLQASADSYAKAGNPSRKEQALKLLKAAQEQREIAISLAEVLHAPMIGSTAAFTTPSPTSEKAVGLEKFEHADVHANIIVNRNELKVGEPLDLEIELANAGKGTAVLDKIEGAIPKGFDITEKPQNYRIEGCNVNMRGRRLEQLKSEEVRLSLRPNRKGSFTLKPVISYIDENGNAKTHQPEPIIITVKELGISGWIKGER